MRIPSYFQGMGLHPKSASSGCSITTCCSWERSRPNASTGGTRSSLKQHPESFGHGGCTTDSPARRRTGNFKEEGVQHQGQTFSFAVERISKQGMSDGLEMYTYLMSPAGKQFYAHQGKVPV